MAQLKIGNKKENPKSTFKFHFEWFHGDGDAYSSSEVFFNENDNDLQRFTNFVTNFPDLYGADVEDVDDDLKSEIDYFSDYKRKTENRFDFETDNTCDGCCYAQDQSPVEITYFDENGVEHEVELIP